MSCIVSGIGLAGVSLFRDPATSKESTVAAGRTPVLSIRRMPVLLADSIEAQRIGRSIASAFAQRDFDDVAERSCVLAEVVTPFVSGRPLVSVAPTRSVIPASTMKVITASAVLAMFDPNERLRTTVRATAAPTNGQLGGDLWIIGGGDPLLESVKYTKTKKHLEGIATSLDKLADDVVAAGVTRISGRVIGDDRLFDDIRVLPTWKKTYVSQGEVGPLGGLIIDDNFTLLDSRGRPIAATDVPTNGAQAFQRLLEARGVVVDGEPGSAPRTGPDAATVAPIQIAAIDSVPMRQIVAQMLTESDNTTAEALLKLVGVRSGGTGSTQAGAAAIGRTLWARGIPNGNRETLRIADGSGLDRGDRVSCAALVDVLRMAPPSGDLISGFAVMGKTGTLKSRLRGTAAEGKVNAKTGSLNGVSALTGTAQTADGRRIRFAMVLNGLVSADQGVKFGDDFSEALVGVGETAPDAALAPKA